MSEKIRTAVLSLPSKAMNCGLCGKQADGQCTQCSAPVCKVCWKTHKDKHKPSLTAMNCVTCGLPPDGQCAYCPAPLCQNWGCREEHEAKHSDARSDEEKRNNPLKIKRP